jgi:hypothetical protein
MPELHETRIGQKFLDHTMPNLVEALEHLARALEKQKMSPGYYCPTCNTKMSDQSLKNPVQNADT